MRELNSERRDRRLDLAAHAAWLYYIAGNTQDEIAAKLNVSRQMAQRLVALAASEQLIKFRLDHPLSACIALAESLRDRFDYPVPTPVVATSVEERQLLQTQRSFIAVKSLAEQAKATFIGIGQIAWNAPLHQDGFINDDEVTELIELGAIGEIAGWAYDRAGILLQSGTNERVASIPLEQSAQRLIIGVVGGAKKAEAILAALRGKLITGLITDEAAAQAILSLL